MHTTHRSATSCVCSAAVKSGMLRSRALHVASLTAPQRTSCRQSRMQTGHEGLSLSQRATHAAWKVCAHAGRMLSSSPAMHGVAGWVAGWLH